MRTTFKSELVEPLLDGAAVPRGVVKGLSTGPVALVDGDVLVGVVGPGFWTIELLAPCVAMHSGLASLVQRVPRTKVANDPEKQFTTVSHRPAINPQLAALERHIGNLTRRLDQRERTVAQRAAASARPRSGVPADDPVDREDREEREEREVALKRRKRRKDHPDHAHGGDDD